MIRHVKPNIYYNLYVPSSALGTLEDIGLVLEE